MKPTWVNIGDALKAGVFLSDYLNTDEISHSGRTLWHHLMGTANILREWGMPESVVLAGMYHSIYGTTQFRTSTFPIQGRHIIQRLIGVEAEELAFYFCVINRSKAPWTTNEHRLERELYTIEAANLIEQKEPTESVAWLLKMPLLPGVEDQIRRYVNEGNNNG